ncbi:MAG: Peptidoglycan D,D-transpeptidase MrdA [uncultured Acidimicrobiales bacterium]|uniref:Peptidoglycan D,D-transpeptidase MrdA n=1 Tax=uncultured Acidimicrobiales bacterium TaxID=310071 RepID=A0A6J4IXK6_9ACTN|nr:MAG: Peptidoglycan D,D-transpeptidase MrdA [uncultured Acidimicrobiales bacterium]
MSTNAHVRLSVIAVVVVGLFSAMFARLWYLQVLDSNSFIAAASANEIRFVHTEAPRGEIRDRRGRPLVVNKRVEAITVDLAVLAGHPDRNEVLGRLATLLEIGRPELDKRLADLRHSRFRPVPVAEAVPEHKVTYLAEHRTDFPGVQSAIIAQRSYPNGSIASHLLGYVLEISAEKLQERKAEGYRLGDAIGQSGIELVHERDLRGVAGVTKLQVDAKGRVLSTLDHQPPVAGHDVHLTIDLEVQRLAEESLLQGLEVARGLRDNEEGRPFVAPAGAVVVLDPSDGSVLAMASYPTYDPSEFVAGLPPERYRELVDDTKGAALTNRAIQSGYAPGSTFKLVTAAAATERGMVDPRTTITDRGSFTIPSCRGEQCTKRNAGGAAYGSVNLSRSLTVSSDVYFYDLGARFWLEKGVEDGMQDTAKAYGLGSRTGISLPSERPGLIPDPDLKKRRHAENPVAFPEGTWQTGDSVNMAIGQGDVLVTPLQLASTYATFGNGGSVFRPRVAARVVDRQGNTVREEPAAKVRTVEVSPAVDEAIRDGLRGVVADREGTARTAFAGYSAMSVAGKTGTAQVTSKQDSAIFAAFAPVNAPRYAIAVVMEESGFGGAVAAPVARRIFEGVGGQQPGSVFAGDGFD